MSIYYLRRLLRGSDTRRAAIIEADLVRAALGSQPSPSPWDEAADGICVGNLRDGHPLLMPASALEQHSLSLGPTGGGKTANDSRLAVECCTPESAGMVVWGNSKPDVIAYFRAGLAHKLMGRSAPEVDGMLGRIAVLAPASSENLVPLQLLALPRGADPELLAFDAASSFANLADSAIGVRQEDDVNDVCALLTESGLPITVAARLLRSPELIVALGNRSPTPERFLAFALRVRRSANSDRLGGLISRFNRITRLRSMRRMLGGAKECVDFSKLMGGRQFILVDLSAPAHGCEEAIRFVGHFLWKRLVRATLCRPIRSPHLPVWVDEFQELLGTGPDVAADLERCLRLVRARGLSFHLATQTLSGLERHSSSLPEILRVNVGLRFAFRGADLWDSALPVTGTKRRGCLPWESPHGSVFLSRGEELSALRAQLETLPNRHCFVHDARSGRPAVLATTADAKLTMPAGCPEGMLELLERGTQAVPVADLEDGLAAVERRLVQLAGDADVPDVEDSPPPVLGEVLASPSPSAPKRRGKRPMDMG